MKNSTETITKKLLAKAKTLPTKSGVYVMKDATGTEIYVGKAKNLRARVSSYFRNGAHENKTLALIAQIADVDYAVTASEIEALLLESNLIKDLQPRYNLLLKHNELYPYLEVTWDEDFPRVLITRRKNNEHSRYFGPFVGVGDLRAALNQLQRLFQFRLCHKKLGAEKMRRERGCLNYHISRCAGICRGAMNKDEYRQRIAGLCRFLSGQKKDLLADLQNELKDAVKNLHFETAAALRDLIGGLENLNQYPVFDETLTPSAPNINPAQGLQKLQTILQLDFLPRTIEGFDIANLQGKETVGSLVSFIDGLPLKNNYRRFRIKTVEGQNDFACLQEVIRRRYAGENLSKTPMPDIILIDGGVGQLNAVAETLREIKVTPRVLLSLAKKEELIYRDGVSSPIGLTKRNPALRLLMYVRDEAHRFAQHYHHILRNQVMFKQ